MKTRLAQYTFVIFILAGVTVGWFYYRSNAAEIYRSNILSPEYVSSGKTKTINASQVGKLTNGLVGYWTFDGADITSTTASDKNPTVTKNNGTLNGSPTPVIGRIGQALAFNGSTMDVVLPTLSAISQASAFTVSAWVKLDAFEPYDGSGVIYQMGGPTAQSPWFREMGDGSLNVLFDTASANEGNLTTDTNYFSIGQWVFATATWDGGSDKYIRIYRNGSLYVTSSSPTVNSSLKSIGVGTGNIGGRVLTEANFLDGTIDEVRVYNRALSASEVTELYQQGQTKINASQVNKLTSGLVGYYTFDGADTTTAIATDKSPLGGNDGTLNSTPTPAIGKIGQALSFSGSNNVSVATTISVKSVSLWIKASATASKRIIELDASKIIETDGSSAITATNFTAPTAYLDGATSPLIIDTNWHHVVVTTDSAIFADTIRIAGSSSNFVGIIDEVRIYNRALSQSEVTELYNLGR